MAEPIIQVIFQNRILETVKINKNITMVGRMSDNDIVINNLGVSRHHCRVVREEGGAFIVEDLESANGIRVNGIQVKRCALENGDEVIIGKHKLVFQITERGVAGFFMSEEEKKADARAADRTIVTAPSEPPKPPPELEISSVSEPVSPQLVSPPPPSQTPQTSEQSAPEKPTAEAPHKAHYDHKMFEYVLKWSEYGVKVSFEGKVISVHALKKPLVTIGRGIENDIVIDNLGVSRLHAKIMQVDNQYIIEDQSSANGIRVNGVFVKSSPLYPGDEILVGKHLLTFDMSQRLLAGVQPEDIRRPAHSERWQDETYSLIPPIVKEEEAASAGQEDEPPGKEAAPWEGKYAVKVTLDSREVATYAITKRVTCIGRLKENDIVIDNLGVSRLHAKIMIEDNGQVYIEDQDSANGIVVNGLPLRRSPLYPGDEIIIVKHKLLFELAHKTKPQFKAAGGVMSTDPWSQDSTMMVSEADRERLRKQREERASKEKAEAEAGPVKKAAARPPIPAAKPPAPPKAAPPPPSKPAPPPTAQRVIKEVVKPAPVKPGPAVEREAATATPADTAPVGESPLQEAAKVEVRRRKFSEPTPLYVLAPDIGPPPAAAPVAPIKPPPSAGRIAKLVLSDGRELKITTEFVLGKGKDVDLKVKGFLIKKRHVFIRREDTAFKLISKALIKQPKINSVSSAAAILKTGDVIELGDIKATFHLEWEE